MHPIFEHIKKAQSIVLSTHTQPDGDGLGSQLAMYWALKKAGKTVRVLNVDETPKKYHFLEQGQVIETFNKIKNPIKKTDLALIFDTNDPTLLLGLWPELQKNCSRVLFIDHHPPLDGYPLDENHFIDIGASSTGQLVYSLIKGLEIPMDRQMAVPLYTSIVFDTNNFRYIRNDPTPHLIAAELLRHQIEPQKVHRHLFGNHTAQKIKFLSQILGSIDYHLDGRLACVRVKKGDMEKFGLEMDETRDIIDMIINVESIEAAALFREDADNTFKLSFRSKGILKVHHLAQSLGGGGHNYASGAYIKKSYQEIIKIVVEEFEKLFDDHEHSKSRIG
ncbi:MAG: DHH family phosphoesterase [Oligoflexia bacterium]|nr:DHH family phosphoesterase [Oligoflexia bacterium]